MPNTIKLVCYTCGKSKTVLVSKAPRFGFEVENIANDAGMLGMFDWNRNRTLIFCDDECCEKALTKAGTYRAKPLYRSKQK